MGLFTSILVSEVKLANRKKVKRTQAALDRSVREMLANAIRGRCSRQCRHQPSPLGDHEEGAERWVTG